MADSSRLMAPEAVAERWGVSRAHVYRLTREGKLNGAVVKLGRYYRYRVDGIEAFEQDGGTR